ncbi:DUF5687 family protein [Psychroflexus salis]|nr:DUF5687 family protein [Psychroflexus salis]
MTKTFLSLEWKKFSRSAAFSKGLVIKILMIFGALYFGGIAIFMGGIGFKILQKAVPDVDPLITLNQFLLYWVLGELALRFFMHQMPVMNIKPLMTLPIKRSKVIQFLLNKTIFSFFNLIGILFFIPFSAALIYFGYAPLQVAAWLLSLMGIVLCLNFINFLINKNNTYFYVIASFAVLSVLLNNYNIISFTKISESIFYALYQFPYLVVFPLLLAFILYKSNYNLLAKHFYLDGIIRKKIEKVETKDLSFMDQFGDIAPFLKNDIRMIWRNKRPKQVLFTAVFFVFYGLFFFTFEIYKDNLFFTSFASIFITGGFLLTFGQYVPSWDSEYYKLMMSQNIPYYQYLKSKWSLMVVGVLIAYVLSIPYIYFGIKIFAMISAAAVFNVGLNSFITLYGGALNRVPVELNVKASAFGNTQGFNATQLLISLPKMIGPYVIFIVPYYFIGFKAGIIALSLSGILGLVFTKFFLKFIEKTYQKGKYKTIAAFAEK